MTILTSDFPELSDDKDKPVAILLIEAGTFEEIGKRARQ
jgi:hypothetical protein